MKGSKLGDDLNGCLFIFEILGMQFFSLKSISQDDFKQRLSIFRITYFLVFCVIDLGFAYFIIRGTLFLDKMTTKNVLTIIFLHLVYVTNLAAFLVGFVQSVTHTKIIKKFYKNFQELYEICYNDFNITMNFAQIRSLCFKKIWATIIFLGMIFAGYLATRKFFLDEKTLMWIIANIITIFTTMTAIKYSLIVDFVNFQLSYLEKLFQATFKRQRCQIIVTVQVFEKPDKEKLRKLNKALLIYSKICENAAIVNKSMGLTMLLILIVAVTLITNEGFEICVGLMDETRPINIASK